MGGVVGSTNLPAISAKFLSSSCRKCTRTQPGAYHAALGVRPVVGCGTKQTFPPIAFAARPSLTLNRAMASNLESLVCSLVPQARQDPTVRDDLVAHCGEIINR